MSGISIPQIVPWRTPEDFCKVYKRLYSESISDKRWAVDEISVWETRCYPTIPSGIEITVSFVRAQIQDLLFQVDKTFCQEADIQMMYTTAVMRFSGIMFEPHQKGPRKIGMNVIAEKLKIPSWMVELRNKAAHSCCPSLPLLRMACDFVLQYMDETYWKLESTKLRPIINQPTAEDEEIPSLIAQYKNIQFKRLEETDMRKNLRSDLRAVIKRIAQLLDQNSTKVVKALAKPGAFIAAEDIRKLLKTSGLMFLEDENNLSLPYEIENFWMALLRVVHTHDEIPTFLEMLLMAQKQVDIPVCQKMAAAWAMQILLGPASNSPIANFFKRKGMLLDYHRLLYACMEGSNKYSLHVITMIINKLGDHEKYSEILALLAIKQGWLVDTPPKGESSHQSGQPPPMKRAKLMGGDVIFTVQDLEDDLNEERAKKGESIWSLAPVSINFEEIPLGAIIKPVLKDPENSVDESSDELVSLGVDPNESFIINNEGTEEEDEEEEVTFDTNKFPVTVLPDDFDMVYRKHDIHLKRDN